MNTYAFDKWNHSYTLDVNDSSNCIIEDGDYSDVNYVMQTSMRVSNTILTKGKLLEADINVNTGGYYNAEGEYIDIKWCNGVVANHYDIQSVMAHEMGHVLGFPDFYESFASTWTMYGSGPPGTTAQRSLETADIQYLKQLHS